MLASAHDLSDGGLAVALAEACLRGGRGCRLSLAGVSAEAPTDVFTALFSESAGRAVVSVRAGYEDDFTALAAAHAVPARVLGRVGGDELSVEDGFTVSLAELERVWTGTLPALFG
jgi:phosphoribosylformylglycinamidine (FGAM) synthase-like enzyme